MASISTLTDDFNTGPNPALWVNYGWQINSGYLYAHSDSEWQQPGLVSRSTYRVGGSSVSFRVGTVDTSTEQENAMIMCVISENPNAPDCLVSGWIIRDTIRGPIADVCVPGQPFFGGVQHVPGNRYRIRELGYLVFEYSTNGSRWVWLHSEPLVNALPAGGAATTVGIVGETPEGAVTTLRVDGVNV